MNEDEPASELSELDRVDSIIREMEKTSNPNAKFWLSYLEMVGILLRFIRAERSGNWKLHLDSFQEMMPWFAAYDRINYLHWGSVYLSNMQRLQITAPEVSVEFEKGNFVVRTKLAHFKGQSVDLSQEHVIKMCKVSGGIIGITRNESALNRWCLTASAMCKMAQKTLFMFDVAIDDGEFNDDMKGRKEKDSDTIAVNKLYEQLSTMSLFDNEGANLVNIANGNVASDEITKGLLNARDTGQKSYDEFVSRFSESVESSIQDPITLLKLPTFDSLYKNTKSSKSREQISQLKQTSETYATLFALAQSGRFIDTDATMSTEQSTYPAGLADSYGNLTTPGNKSALISLLMGETDHTSLTKTWKSTVLLIDGMAFVRSIGRPKHAKNFGDLADAMKKSVAAFCTKYSVTRVDLIFDRYLPDSVKNATRSKRRRNKIGINKQIANRCTALPSDLDTFYTIQSNKENLERFLTDEFLGWSDVLPRVELVTSGGFQDATKAASSIGRNVTTLYSNHEEADTRILLHGKDAARCVFYRTVVFSVDTDVLVLLLHHHEFLTNEIWMQHGALSNSTFIPVHEIAAVTEAAVLQNLPAFHAITGCDSTSQLRYHTKISS